MDDLESKPDNQRLYNILAGARTLTKSTDVLYFMGIPKNRSIVASQTRIVEGELALMYIVTRVPPAMFACELHEAG